AGVLGSPQSVGNTLSAIRSPRGPALVTAPGQILGSSYWGANLPATWLLARRLGMSLRASGLAFAAGSMYWIAPSILDQLTKLGLGPENFEPELGQDDGTTAHAIERLIGIIAQQQGGIVAADDVLH
ncbi:MAG TPA: glycosyl transferase family 2, partial [Actinomycetales bacterium]|nr:glycosyl transferase family 2 [Actinomycetales bacterium]